MVAAVIIVGFLTPSLAKKVFAASGVKNERNFQASDSSISEKRSFSAKVPSLRVITMSTT